MVKPLKSGVISLNKKAKDACLEMMQKIQTTNCKLKIDHSKLVSFIVAEYKEKYFSRNIDKITSFHKDSRKEINNKLNTLSHKELETLSKYISKLRPEGELSEE